MAGVGNTALFALVLALIFWKIATHEYLFAMAVALGGIYAEAWNYRVSNARTHEEDDEQAQQRPGS